MHDEYFIENTLGFRVCLTLEAGLSFGIAWASFKFWLFQRENTENIQDDSTISSINESLFYWFNNNQKLSRAMYFRLK